MSVSLSLQSLLPACGQPGRLCPVPGPSESGGSQVGAGCVHGLLAEEDDAVDCAEGVKRRFLLIVSSFFVDTQSEWQS